jgi:hypothetical protein
MAAIVAGDIEFRGSTTAGSAGDTNAFGGPDTSLGKYPANAVLPAATKHALFDAITGAENAGSVVQYACLFLYNKNTANILQNAGIYFSAEVTGGVEVALGVDPTAADDIDSATPTAVTIANKTTAPAGVVFTVEASVDSVGEALSLGNIPVDGVKAFWVRITAANTAALNDDGFTLGWFGDTGAL